MDMDEQVLYKMLQWMTEFTRLSLGGLGWFFDDEIDKA